MRIEETVSQIESILSELSYKESSIVLKRLIEARLYRYPLLDMDAELHFPRVQEVRKTKVLFEFLLKGKYISDSTKERDFMYYLGHYYCTTVIDINSIQWIESKQLLRELLEALYSDVMSKTDIKRIAMSAFTDKYGHYMLLAKKKEAPSTKSDKLKEFLATNNVSNNQQQ